jgi:hypothetical protein
VLRRWLREAETLSDTEEKVVYLCELESGESLGDEEEMRLVRYLVNFQEGKNEFLYFQVGNEMISVDLIDYQEVISEIPNCQVGKGDKMRLSESLMNSYRNSYQQGVLVEEDKRSILIIGGIGIFLPISQVEASAQFSGVVEERQPTKTIIKEEKM